MKERIQTLLWVILLLLALALTVSGHDVCAEEFPCQNGGTCVVRHSREEGYLCRCPEPYKDYNCTRDTDACRSSPCQNNGTCKNRKAEGTYRCKCPSGTDGFNCEIVPTTLAPSTPAPTPVNECDDDPCFNGATCYDLVQGFFCACAEGFMGHLCDTNSTTAVQASCSGRDMVLTLSRGLLQPSHGSFHVHLADESCMGIDGTDEGQIELTTLYDQCGTNLTEDGDTITFSNVVLYTNLEFEDLSFRIPVECVFERDELVAGLPYLIESELDGTITEHGHFRLTLDRYGDFTYSGHSSDEKAWLKQKLYYAVNLDSVPIVTVFLDSCWATPTPSSNDTIRYDLIDNGCPVDTTLDLFTNLGELREGFSFKAFAFVGDYTEVYIHCAVKICATDSTNNECVRTCASARRRRSASDDVGGLLVSNRIVTYESPEKMLRQIMEVERRAHS